MFRQQWMMMLAVALVGISAFAQLGDTITWKSTTEKTEGAWSDPTQWDLGRVPEAGDIVILPSPSSGTAKKTTYTSAASGGSVNLQCGRRLSGTAGSVTANGGTGDGTGGAGGGGRIAICYVACAEDLSLCVAAAGGSFKTEIERSGMWGEDGTVVWKQMARKGLMLVYR